jgi:hypothetical protein
MHSNYDCPLALSKIGPLILTKTGPPGEQHNFTQGTS